MVFYHAFFMLGYFFEIEFLAKAQVFFEPLQPFFACLFIFISGISSNLSRSNFKRGIRLLGIAVGFTLVTAVILPKFEITGAEIYFGVLHLLSVSMLIYALLRKPLSKVPTAVGVVIMLALFVLTFTVQQGQLLGFDLPREPYDIGWLAPLGFPARGFYSADYFPILPYIFMFFAGTFFGRLAENNALPKSWYVSRCKPLSAIGKKTLIIYILHWPIIFLIGLIISNF
jgi:uncharacterized membrane protein